ncbi:MAG: hypothetical protein ACFN27_05335 [Prevotella sp.]
MQRAEDIMDFLIVIGAMKAMTEFESQSYIYFLYLQSKSHVF